MPHLGAATAPPNVADVLKDYKTCQALLEKLSAMHAQVIQDNASLCIDNAKLHDYFSDNALPDTIASHSSHAVTCKSNAACSEHQGCADEKDVPEETHGRIKHLTTDFLTEATKFERAGHDDFVSLNSDGTETGVRKVKKETEFDSTIHDDYAARYSDGTETSGLAGSFEDLKSIGTKNLGAETPLERWQTLVFMLFNPNAKFFRRDVQQDLEFLPVWLISAQTASARTSVEKKKRHTERERRGISLHGQYVTSTNPFQKIIMDPDGHKPMFWCSIGAVLLLYDLVVTPLSFFELTTHALDFMSTFNKITLAYWILDVFVQLCTGFDTNGVVDMRPLHIFRHYIRTWFFPDMLILSTDIALLYVTAFVGGASSLRIVRVLRLLRLARFLRIRRLQSLAPLFESMSVQISSAYIQLVFRLLQHVCLIIMINHYIACAWFYVSWQSVQSSGYHVSWLRTFEVENSAIVKQYTMAFHWSLTQFSPATNNISPQNTAERAFACAVVVFAMIVFSSFVSNLTSTVNKLNQLNAERLREEALIRRFLRERSISIDLGSNIMRFFKSNFYRNSTRVQKSDMRILAELPPRLTRRLDEEMYATVLLSSSLVGKFIECDKTLVSKLCHDCTSMLAYMAHQDVFTEEIECTSVYYMADGDSTYLAARYRASTIFQPPKMNPDIVNIGDWLSEMAFWVPWHHQGRLNCVANSEFIHLHCKNFASCISNNGGEVYHSMCVLAIYVVAHIEKCVDDGDMLTDVAMVQGELDNLTSHCLKFCRNFQNNYKSEGSIFNQGLSSRALSSARML